MTVNGVFARTKLADYPIQYTAKSNTCRTDVSAPAQRHLSHPLLQRCGTNTMSTAQVPTLLTLGLVQLAFNGLNSHLGARITRVDLQHELIGVIGVAARRFGKSSDGRVRFGYLQ